MMFIPGQIVSLVTFPGVIVHEAAHQLFCRWARVAVLEVCYFRFGNPAGYVAHEPPRKEAQHLLIGMGPFFVNSVVGALVAMPGAIAVFKFEAGSWLDYLLVWCGVSIAMHAFPSTGDAQAIWRATKHAGASIWVKAVGRPLAGLIYLGAVGSFIWLDVMYGIALAVGLPYLLVSLMA